MILKTLEGIFIQVSFVIFFVLTLFSWGKIILFEKGTSKAKQEDKIQSLIEKTDITFISIFLGFSSVTGLCLIRWTLSDHLPLSNLYESSLFLSWSFILSYLIFKRRIENEWLDAIIAPILLLTTTFATLGLPKQLQEATALVPALQSNWLMMHVTMMILSYGALIFGSLLAVTLLTLTMSPIKRTKMFFLLDRGTKWRFDSKNKLCKNEYILEPFQDLRSVSLNNQFSFGEIFSMDRTESEKGRSLKEKNQKNIQEIKEYSSLETNWNHYGPGLLQSIYLEKNKATLINQIDYWSYRIIGIGFPLLTLGILSGAVWANEAWGSYWNWDPKETWALITWVIFAIYLHIRITKGWNGIKPALVAFLGFFVVWICYLGVNLLGKGLHSYGWLN